MSGLLMRPRSTVASIRSGSAMSRMKASANRGARSQLPRVIDSARVGRVDPKPVGVPQVLEPPPSAEGGAAVGPGSGACVDGEGDSVFVGDGLATGGGVAPALAAGPKNSEIAADGRL